MNLAADTELSIALRKACAADPGLCRTLFGREQPPMIFQYNPFDYHVESTEDEGELVVTVLRRTSVAPRIRYNIKDLGGGLTYRHVASVLAERGMSMESLAPVRPAFPFLYVFGRSDLSVPFYGAKVFTTDLDTILHETPEIAGMFSSFQLSVRETEELEKRLVVRSERAPAGEGEKEDGARRDAPTPQTDDTALSPRPYDRLKDMNQDFREVSKLIGPEAIEVALHDNGAGPFEARDRRVKERYLA